MKGREYIAPVNRGVLPDNVRKAIATLLAGMEGKVVKVTIAPHNAKRSQSQNGYYHAVIVPHWKALMKEFGTIATDEEVHSFLVQHVGKLNKTIVGPDSMIYTVTPSTSDLDTKEFTDFLEICRTVAGEYGRDIPPPDKHYKER